MTPLRIGYPLKDGAAAPAREHEAALSLALALHEAGHQPVIITSAPGPLNSWCRHAGLETAHLALPAPSGARKAPRSWRDEMERTADGLKEQVAALNLDVVHTRDATAHLVWAVIAQRAGIAHVWQERSDFRYPEWAQADMEAAGAIIGGSKLALRKAPAAIAAKTKVMPDYRPVRHDLSAHEDRARLERLTGTPSGSIVVFAGDTADLKNAALAIEAARLAAALREDVTFCVAGRIANAKWPRQRDKTLKGPLEGRWIELDDAGDLASLVSGADLAIPLSTGAENLQMVMAAGVYAGTPVLVPEKKDASAAYIKAFPACLVKPWTAQMLGGAIIMLETARESFSASVEEFRRDFAAKHAGPALIARITNFYAKLAKARPDR